MADIDSWFGPTEVAIGKLQKPVVRVLRPGRPPVFMGECHVCGCVVEATSVVVWSEECFTVDCPLGIYGDDTSPACRRIRMYRGALAKWYYRRRAA